MIIGDFNLTVEKKRLDKFLSHSNSLEALINILYKHEVFYKKVCFTIPKV